MTRVFQESLGLDVAAALKLWSAEMSRESLLAILNHPLMYASVKKAIFGMDNGLASVV